MRQPSSLLYGPRLAQQYGRSKDCQRSCSVLHDGALHAPFPTNTPYPPPSLSLPFPLFQGHGFGTGPPAGGWNWNALISRSLETSLFLLLFLFSFHPIAYKVLALIVRACIFSSMTQPEAWICIHFKSAFLIDQMKIVLIWVLSLRHSAVMHSKLLLFYRQ